MDHPKAVGYAPYLFSRIPDAVKIESLQKPLRLGVQYALEHPYQVATIAVLLIIGITSLSSVVTISANDNEVPLYSVRSAWEPQIWSSWNFFRRAAEILNGGYKKFPNRIWKFTRADVDMLVLPPRYVKELRSLPIDIASPTAAHAFNLSGSHTNMNIILKNNLHFRTLQEKLTPNLNRLARPMQEELEYAINMEIPESNGEWVQIKPYHSILRLVARVSARVFLGVPLCRSEEWLEISTEFTENTFISLVILRMFPRFLHGIVSWFLPSVWRANNYIRRAKRLLTPEIKERQAAWRKGYQTEKQMSLLSWMIEIASEAESKPQDLAHLEVVISLASIHTSQMNAVHVLYDLAAHPECIPILLEEIDSVVKEKGDCMSWDKTSFYKLKRLDSLMRESQRHNPPTLLSYHRIMQRDHILSDGMVLPKGAHITMPVNAIQNDPLVTPDPEEFQPWRYFDLRSQEGQGHLHQFATTEENILNFGKGKFACPGRFFASLEIKTILVRLLMDYDWRLPVGTERPANVAAHEFIFPKQEGVLEFRKRKKPEVEATRSEE
ncbi:cytochrome P450 [Pseudovirgaria hyperparasitica]|uniref:Cytochrome P450 n=1 Tax=Pseudovirgaria hyperparasitica TaxID=470096 RepID=A0A6A6WME7_9PEZI|nr:cytochrome P450 [Pseudovirgaria hyperparasitica]KAF2763381.1 cytochrome P450 [Pseudovirgaria hyperparasitica]